MEECRLTQESAAMSPMQAALERGVRTAAAPKASAESLILTAAKRDGLEDEDCLISKRRVENYFSKTRTGLLQRESCR